MGAASGPARPIGVLVVDDSLFFIGGSEMLLQAQSFGLHTAGTSRYERAA
jgi:hypothetical protein